jgi:hypothetical protein
VFILRIVERQDYYAISLATTSLHHAHTAAHVETTTPASSCGCLGSAIESAGGCSLLLFALGVSNRLVN